MFLVSNVFTWNESFDYFIPVLIMLGICVSVLLSHMISLKLYNVIYYIVAVYSGFMLYGTLFSAMYELILHFYPQLDRIFGIIINLLTPAIICVYGIINAKIIHIEYHDLKFPNFPNKKIICHLSDIHLGAIYQKDFVRKIVKKVKAINPDVVVITGDLADGTQQVLPDWLLPFNSLNVPVLYITGNHEELHGKSQMLNALESTNIKHIGKNTYKTHGMNFIGIDYEYDIRAQLNEFGDYGNSNADVPNIVLHHVPKLSAKELEKYNIFLMLAGHTHGGQMFPLQLLVYLGNTCFNGWYRNNEGNRFVYVSSGVGTNSPPMRVGSKSVITVISIDS